MRFRFRAGFSALPRTHVGRWLWAGLTGQRELRERLRPALNGGRDGWNDDEPAVVQAACELAVRQYFRPGYDVRQVTAFVAELRDALAGDPPVDQLAAEAVIRSALGETDVTVDGISPGAKYLIHSWAVTLATARSGLSESAIGQLIAEAENIAFEQGWHPPLAD